MFRVTYIPQTAGPDGQGSPSVTVDKDTLADACRFACSIPSRFRVSIDEIEVLFVGEELDALLSTWDANPHLLAKALR